MCTAQTFIGGEFVLGSDNRLISEWRSFKIPNKAKKLNLGHIETQGSRLVITAVATLEQKYTVQSNDGHESRRNFHSVIDQRSRMTLPQSSSNDSEELEEREKLRRMRISKANKGNTPWNKGRKHSAETLQRIKERTRLAMQNPKVKMKLVNLGHAQSKETRIKIGVSVRVGWERRREKLMIQENCHFEWQNLIAEASRKGIGGEEDLRWDSYEILDKQFELEWLESVEKRKNKPQLKGGNKGPKSPEQRRKISEAISAKWTDPGYRDRVFSALSKYHGTPVGVPRKAKRKPSADIATRKRSPLKKKVNNKDNSEANEAKSQSQRPRLRRSNVPLYKDPLAGSKLEMIKNIRAQRASADTQKTEAIERAKLLIAEAEKAAKALEVAAKTNPLAQASLIETRMLISEAIQSIQSIRTVQIHPRDNGINSLFASTKLTKHGGKEKAAEVEDQGITDHRKINGSQAVESSESNVKDFGFGQFSFQDLFNGKDELLPRSLNDYRSLNGKEEFYNTFSDNGISTSELDNMIKDELGQRQPNGNDGDGKMPLPNGKKLNWGKEDLSSNSIVTTKKRWVRGKLVELAEEDSD